jgi:hypothetical protein
MSVSTYNPNDGPDADRDDDASKLSCDELRAILSGEPVPVELPGGEAYEFPGEALNALMFEMSERERNGWTRRLGNAASAEVAERIVAQLLGAPGQESSLTHVVATEGVWGTMFRTLFARAGIDANDPANVANVQCDSRTRLEEYYAWAYDQLLASLADKEGDAAKEAFQLALQRIRGRLGIGAILR